MLFKILRNIPKCLKQQNICMSTIGHKEKRKVKNEDLPIFQYASGKQNMRVYVWGLADTGALGIPNTKIEKQTYIVKNPKRLSFAEKHKVTDLACGFGFTVFTTESNDEIKLYGTGINTDSQIGYHELQRSKPLELLLFPAPIKLPPPFDKKSKILKLSAGRAHLLVLTSEGLFTLGNNSYGQCGRKIIENEKYLGSSTIHYIDNIDGQKIVDIQCGQDHSLAVTEKGEVYACGWGADGQTGLGHSNNIDVFTKVTGDVQGEKITKLASTGDCVLALNDKNEIFGWGNSEYGQLQLKNDEQQVTVSKHLPFSKDIGTVVDIASGGSFCMALNDEGHVYVWGYGLLGRGVDYDYPTPWRIPPVLFGYNVYQPDNKVSSIACGIGHLAAVTTLGDLFMWGRNRNGCLGVGHLENQIIPLKVAGGAAVVKVFCGLDHSIAICKPFV